MKAQNNTLVIFGAPDHEEQLARLIAEKAGCQIATATCQGKPVHAGNAYNATGFYFDNNPVGVPITKIILFECSYGALSNEAALIRQCEILRCDHHNPGDPGYDRPATEYILGSSLGQMCYELGLYDELPDLNKDHGLLMVMAGDHCPADAYAGRCPGIDPEEFYLFRIKQKADFEYAKMSEVEKAESDYKTSDLEAVISMKIEDAEDLLKASPEIDGIVDLREHEMITQLPEAALKTGRAYMSKIKETDREGNETGNFKIVFGGHTTPRQVETFMDKARTINNRVGEPYGNPTRGYAGVVVTPLSTHCQQCGEIWACDSISVCPGCGLQYPEEW